MRISYQIECLRCDVRKDFTDDAHRDAWKHFHWRKCKGAMVESQLITDYDQCDFCGHIGICHIEMTSSVAWCGRCEGALIESEVDRVVSAIRGH